MDFKNKTVIVTGAASGIGRHLAAVYAQCGANVVLADLNQQDGELNAHAIRGKGGKALFMRVDVGMEEDVIRLIQESATVFGRVDILINNAGIGRSKSVYELTVDEWEDVLRTNLRGTFLCSREAAKRMRKNESGGAIVNIASTRALMSEPNTEAYAASKGGIVALTHSLAVSLGPDRIRVNCISPGWIETGSYDALREVDHAQHPARRVGRPEDIVHACFYLTDPENTFVTGTNLIVDGGMTRRMMYEP